jgi:hypothetical protein
VYICTVFYFKMEAIKQVYTKVRSEYGKNVNNKLKMIDALACYCVVTGVVQVGNRRSSLLHAQQLTSLIV